MNKNRFYPKSLFNLIPVLEYQEKITNNTKMVYRYMRAVEGVIGYEKDGKAIYGFLRYESILDWYHEEMYKHCDAEFYLKNYHNKKDKKNEILHHNFCIIKNFNIK